MMLENFTFTHVWVLFDVLSDSEPTKKRKDQFPTVLYNSCSLGESLSNGVSEDAAHYFLMTLEFLLFYCTAKDGTFEFP